MKTLYRVDGLAHGKWESVVCAESDTVEEAEKKAFGWLTPSEFYRAYERTRVVKVTVSEEIVSEMREG